MHIRSYINQAFSACGVEVNVEQLLPCDLEAGVTNQFFKIHCLAGSPYLVRLNGQLWSPFTREAEDYNLRQLHGNNIRTNVLHNAYNQGFQLCHDLVDAISFNKLCVVEKSASLFCKIGFAIKQFHRIDHFQNTYSMPDTILSGLSRVKRESDKLLLARWAVPVMSLLAVVQSGARNMVASHNDLLPSSIYYHEDQVTFVDWEYSSMNHRAYDLALFSIKGCLLPEQEEIMLRAYDEQDNGDIFYEVAIVKPVIDYLLLLWHVTSKSPSLEISKKLTDMLQRDLRLAEQLHCYYLRSPAINGFFKLVDQTERNSKADKHRRIVAKASL